jgi:L-ascorbate metabolism protein UlaG (beta-lactamase superfamily)
MIIRYLGHAAFLIITQNGTRIITDPYNAAKYGASFRYEIIDEKADIVTVSHEHNDHNFGKVNGDPVYVQDTGKTVVKNVAINGIASYHDDKKGQTRGSNIIFSIEADSLHIVHLGDLGHELIQDDTRKIGSADILLIPVGGTYTIGPETAREVIKTLNPKIVIPMHYKTDKCTFPILPVDDFLPDKKYEHVTGDFEIKKDQLPDSTVIYLLDHTK